MVTCQPAVELSLPLSVAVDAKLHLKVDGYQTVLFFHLSMACGAIDLISDVGFMIEFHVIRDIKYSNPRDGGLRIEVPSLLHNLRMLGNNVLMTEKTEALRRDPGILRAVDKRMTESATDILVSSMNAMTEIDRLLGSDGS